MEFTQGLRTVAAAALVLGLVAGASPSGIAGARAAGAAGSVGFLFPDLTTTTRWQSDQSYYEANLKLLDPNVVVKSQDAKTDQTRQQSQAAKLLSSGVKVLLAVPVDSVQAKKIVQIAHSQKPPVPVIAYDGLIQDAPVDAYVSFDAYAVGKHQAEWLISHVKKGGTIVSIAGPSTEMNAQQVHMGAMSVLMPLVKNGTFKLPYDKPTPHWSTNTAQVEMLAALATLNNKVDGVLVASDGLAGGVIAALKAHGLAGKVPVTGQDATVAGLQNILLGAQSITVYKPLKNLAKAAAQVTDTFLAGKKFTSTTTVDNGMIKVPSILLSVVTVTKDNIKSTVIADGFVTKQELCTGLPAPACKNL